MEEFTLLDIYEAEITLEVNGETVVRDVKDFDSLEELIDDAIEEAGFNPEDEEVVVKCVEVVNVPDGYYEENTTDRETFIDEAIFDAVNALKVIDESDHEQLWDYVSEVKEHDLDDILSGNEDVADLWSECEDHYHGKYDSMQDYAEEFVASCYTLEPFMERYFDYEKFASDLEDDHIITSNGYVFDTNG